MVGPQSLLGPCGEEKNPGFLIILELAEIAQSI
jgi:hypothetical protein